MQINLTILQLLGGYYGQGAFSDDKKEAAGQGKVPSVSAAVCYADSRDRLFDYQQLPADGRTGDCFQKGELAARHLEKSLGRIE